MNLTDYVLDISLIALVLIQIRGRRITVHNLIPPVLISGWAAVNYLHGIPTAGNDLVLVGLAAGLGITLGALCGLFTRVDTDHDGRPVAKAGLIAAVLWVAGVGTRLAFQLYVTHGGSAAVGRFSATHSITSSEAWVAALILMAVGEALTRTAVVAYRGYQAAPSHFLGRPSMIAAGDSAY
jgi:hypothetical protein